MAHKRSGSSEQNENKWRWWQRPFLRSQFICDLQRVSRENEYIAQYLPQLRQLLNRTIFWMVVCEIVIVLQVFPTKLFADEYSQPNTRPWYLLLIAALLLASKLIGTRLYAHMDTVRNSFRHLLKAVLWGEAHRKELELSTAWHVEHGTGEKESIIEKNMEKVDELVYSSINQAFVIILRITLTSIAMFAIGWQFGVLSVLTFYCYVLVMRKIEPFLRPMREEYYREQKELERTGSELSKNWKVLKSFGLEIVAAGRNLMKMLCFWEKETARHGEWRSYMVKFDNLISFSEFLLFALFVWLRTETGMGIGKVILALGWMARIYSNYYNLTDFQHSLHMGIQAAKELIGIFLTVPSVRQSSTPVWNGPLKGKVEFRNVSFAYPNAGSDALTNVNLVVEPNTVVALMGHTGSGKTTLASLLQREYDPTEGKILVDGVDLREVDYLKYRQSIGVVHQHSILFDATIGQNIRISREDAAAGEEQYAAEQAYAHEFINRLPQGYDTQIGEDGVLLSGGQRQRLTIARALHRKPAVLILDEATSGLDAESQLEVQKSSDKLIASRSCTIFVIAHRFSTIMSADIVLVLDKGRIAEIGTHEQLARGNGLYRRLRDLEMGGALA